MLGGVEGGQSLILGIAWEEPLCRPPAVRALWYLVDKGTMEFILPHPTSTFCNSCVLPVAYIGGCLVTGGDRLSSHVKSPMVAGSKRSFLTRRARFNKAMQDPAWRLVHACCYRWQWTTSGEGKKGFIADLTRGLGCAGSWPYLPSLAKGLASSRTSCSSLIAGPSSFVLSSWIGVDGGIISHSQARTGLWFPSSSDKSNNIKADSRTSSGWLHSFCHNPHSPSSSDGGCCRHGVFHRRLLRGGGMLSNILLGRGRSRGRRWRCCYESINPVPLPLLRLLGSFSSASLFLFILLRAFLEGGVELWLLRLVFAVYVSQVC